MTIKLTYFAGGGMALGVCWHHSLGDMDTFIYFMRAWASTINGMDYELPVVVGDRNKYIHKTIEDNGSGVSGFNKLDARRMLSLSSQMLIASKNKRSVKLFFSDSELQNMRQTLSEKAGQKLSINDALCAHLFSTLSAIDADPKTGYLSIVVGYKARVNIPANVLGNFYSIMHTPTEESVEPVKLAKDLRSSIDSFAQQHLDFYATKRYVENNGGVRSIDKFIVRSIDPKKRALLITNWSGFNIFDIKFGEADLFFFTPFGDAPFPWISSLVKGFSNSGLIYSALLPSKLAKAVMRPENLDRCHQYRDSAERLPEMVERLEWLN